MRGLLLVVGPYVLLGLLSFDVRSSNSHPLVRFHCMGYRLFFLIDIYGVSFVFLNYFV